MFDFPLLISTLNMFGLLLLGYLNWRNGRLKPDVDATTMAKDAQQIAQNALDGQVALSNELTDMKKHIKGQYEIKARVRFYPKPEILEVSMELIPPAKRGRVTVDNGS